MHIEEIHIPHNSLAIIETSAEPGLCPQPAHACKPNLLCSRKHHRWLRTYSYLVYLKEANRPLSCLELGQVLEAVGELDWRE